MKPSLEERLGARLPIWIGSIALATAGAFLVKWSFDRGLLGPTTRIVLGLLFGVALLAAGEWVRARAKEIGVGLTAAGIADLYAVLLAAINLYQLIPGWAGFLFIALVTAASVALSLRHGPMIALVGMVGGFVMPALIGSTEPSPGVLFTYLLLLQGGLVVVSRGRAWWALMPLTLAGGLFWVVLWLSTSYEPPHTPWIGAFLVANLVVAALAAVRSGSGEKDEGTLGFGPIGLASHRPASMAGLWISFAGSILLAAALTMSGGLDTTEWVFFGIVGLGAMILAWLDDRYHFLAWLPAAVGVLLLASWGLGLQDVDDIGRFAATIAAIGILFAAAAYTALWRSKLAHLWGALATFVALSYLLVAYWSLEELTTIAWGGVSIGLAALFVALCWPVFGRRSRGDAAGKALAPLAVAATSFVSLSIPLELERAWITVGWAAQAAALAWLFNRLRVGALAWLCGIVAAAVAVRLLLNPFVLVYPIGDHPLFNWLLYGYGLPAALFVLAARLVGSTGPGALHARLRPLPTVLRAVAIAFGFALLGLLTRSYFHPGDLDELQVTLREAATLSTLWLVYATGLLVTARRLAGHAKLLRVAALVVSAIGLGVALLGPGIVINPLFFEWDVGGTIVWNALLYTHALPAALALLLAKMWRDRGIAPPAIVLGAASVAIWLLFVTLEVRQGFQGAILAGGEASNAELWAYSAAWIVFATLLLVVGIRTKSPVARYSSLAIMTLAVGKVFLFDTSELKDLYRVVSFLALGASLLLLAFLYQRFVFRKNES